MPSRGEKSQVHHEVIEKNKAKAKQNLDILRFKFSVITLEIQAEFG